MIGTDKIIIRKTKLEDYKANKIWLDVYADNERALKLYQSMGFLKEGSEALGNSSALLIMTTTNNPITNNY